MWGGELAWGSGAGCRPLPRPSGCLLGGTHHVCSAFSPMHWPKRGQQNPSLLSPPQWQGGEEPRRKSHVNSPIVSMHVHSGLWMLAPLLLRGFQAKAASLCEPLTSSAPPGLTLQSPTPLQRRLVCLEGCPKQSPRQPPQEIGRMEANFLCLSHCTPSRRKNGVAKWEAACQEISCWERPSNKNQVCAGWLGAVAWPACLLASSCTHAHP